MFHKSSRKHHKPAKRALLSLKLAGVRGGTPPYLCSAKRCTQQSHRLTFSPPPLYPSSTKRKSKRLQSSSRSLIAGTGRHMDSNPCKPSPTQGEASGPSRRSPFPASSAELYISTTLHGGSTGHSAYPCLSKAPELAQNTAIASAIAAQWSCSIRSGRFSHSQTANVVHQGGSAALSCRLCLIACNSRQFDEQELEHD